MPKFLTNDDPGPSNEELYGKYWYVYAVFNLGNVGTLNVTKDKSVSDNQFDFFASEMEARQIRTLVQTQRVWGFDPTENPNPLTSDRVVTA